ncbi:Actin-related protein [Schistosoma japonicum]|uniref:Actin-related protein n=1 Tax=Schistosoma japonicum TaxID=6182 RepID=A0A4Z2DX44_SCHJA|nr:Actin-related protein 6 [Schistosoma japonicum]TNN21019.1 Actin-related protein [Schistosoma japonicum]
MTSTLILDMGGGSLKVGFSSDANPKIIDNSIFKSKTLGGRTFVGNEIEHCNNLSSLFCIMPFKKGYINNWEVQCQILDITLKSLVKTNSQNSLSDCNLLVTEPYFNFASTKEAMNEIFFEDYQVAGLIRTNPSFLSAYKYRSESAQRLSRYCIVIDSGYSFTHIVPMADGFVMKDFVLRLTVGGKILTNRLIEAVSYRHLDVRSEIYIMNQCKEDVCYVSTDFWRDMNTSQSNQKSNSILREYVLPNYVDVHRGYVRDPNTVISGNNNNDKSDQRASNLSQQGYILRLNNERFTVPELIFHPSDVGYQEMGLTEAIQYLMNERLPAAVRPGAWANFMVMGGNACFPGFVERLQKDIRTQAPDDLPVNVFKPPNPQTYAWEGGVLLCQNPDSFNHFLVTRKEYEEKGSSYCEKRFPTS